MPLSAVSDNKTTYKTDREGPLQIDLYRILTERLGRKLPRAAVGALERLICQRELNGILQRTWPARGRDFSTRVLEDLEINLEVEGLENVPQTGRFIFASNHPLGGLDGITLISVLGRLYDDSQMHFLVNDMLMNVEPLRDVFLPINKYGSQGRRAAAAIQQAYASGNQIIIFPAGLVSRLHPGGVIRDLDWHKAFVAKAIEHQRDIIPIHFEALNSRRFYRLARLRKQLHIGVNLEQALLPSELVKSRGKTFRITIGKPIEWQKLSASNKPYPVLAEAIKKIVYDLKKPDNQ